MSGLMDFVSGLAAATSAGKMPTTQQANTMTDWLLKSPLIQAEQSAAGAGGKLSQHGEAIARALRELVEAYQSAATAKNGDDVLQDALFEFSRAEPGAATKNPGAEAPDALGDARDLAGAAKVLLEVVLGCFGPESGELGGELASFTRLTIADIAEAVEAQAGAVKEKLRNTEGDVQDGKRDALGRSKDDKVRSDARRTFERRMDIVKSIGGNAIGAGQDVKARSKEISKNVVDRLDELSSSIVQRAQKDPDYRRSVDTLASICHKYLHRAVDRAKDVQSDSDATNIEAQLADIIQDPTGRVLVAVRKLRTLIERFAGGHSLNTIFVALAACVADVRDDNDLRCFFDDFETVLRMCIEEPGYLRSEEYARHREVLRVRWEELKAVDSDAGRKWAADLDQLQREWQSFENAIKKDGSLQRLKEVHVALGRHLLSIAPTAGKAIIGQASWVWTDVTEVLVPRLFAMLKEIPLPRTEYVDADTDFVFENISLKSLHVLPGHIKISHTTSVDVEAPAVGSAQHDISTRTRIQFTGVQLALKEVSFYYHDKGKKAVDTVTGLLDVTIPEKGVDMDITLSMLPTASGEEERRTRGAFHRIENVKANLGDVKISIKKSNHPIVLSLLKPVFRSRLVAALSEALEGYTRIALEAADGLAYDVHRRAGVFGDAGVPVGAAYISGLVSALGHKAQQPGGLLDGVRATSVGVVKDDENTDKAFAIGTAPQLVPVQSRFRPDKGKTVWEQAQTAAGPSIESFADAVARKREYEQKTDGWRSAAYDLPPYLRLGV